MPSRSVACTRPDSCRVCAPLHRRRPLQADVSGVSTSSGVAARITAGTGGGTLTFRKAVWDTLTWWTADAANTGGRCARPLTPSPLRTCTRSDVHGGPHAAAQVRQGVWFRIAHEGEPPAAESLVVVAALRCRTQRRTFGTTCAPASAARSTSCGCARRPAPRCAWVSLRAAARALRACTTWLGTHSAWGLLRRVLGGVRRWTKRRLCGGRTRSASSSCGPARSTTRPAARWPRCSRCALPRPPHLLSASRDARTRPLPAAGPPPQRFR